MIVNRSHAEEAGKLLHFSTLEGLTADRVQIAYRAMAQQTHPDAGGTMEQFAAVNHAKQVLLEWLNRVGEADARSYAPKKCEMCNGTGRIALQANGRLESCYVCHPWWSKDGKLQRYA